jgi:hypothetical protein
MSMEIVSSFLFFFGLFPLTEVRYTEGFYTPNYKLTIGVDFAVKGMD